MANILIIDDEDDFRDSLKTYLEHTFHWTVHEAPNAHEALKAIPALDLDGILLDRRMPDEEGRLDDVAGDKVMRSLFEQRKLCDICVVMLTAYGEVKSASDALSMGAWQYLEKPLDVEDIYRLLAPGIALKKCNHLRTQVAADVGTASIVSQIKNVVDQTLAPDLFKVYFFLDNAIEDMNRRFVREIRDGKPFLYVGTRSEVQSYNPVLEDAGTLMAVRVVTHHTQPCGVVAMESRQEGAFDPRWQEVLGNFANLVGLAATIQHANQERNEAVRRELESLRLLYRELRHRLSTSIATMYQYVDAIMEAQAIEPSIIAKAQVIQKHLNNVNQVMKELREVADQPELVKRPCHFRSLVQEVLSEVKDKFEEMGVMVGPGEVDSNAVAIADKLKLEYCLRCILQNAAESVASSKVWEKAGVSMRSLDDDGREPEEVIESLRGLPTLSSFDVTISVRSTGGCGEIEIRDTGVGFDSAIEARLFAPLFTTKRSADDSPNDGIGLFSVKRLIESMEGTIVAHSAGTGKGAEFTIRLPLVPKEPE